MKIFDLFEKCEAKCVFEVYGRGVRVLRDNTFDFFHCHHTKSGTLNGQIQGRQVEDNPFFGRVPLWYCEQRALEEER